MHKVRSSLVTASTVLLLIAIVTLLAPSATQGQGATLTPHPQNVAVVNSPTVNLASGTVVGLDPQQNVVRPGLPRTIVRATISKEGSNDHPYVNNTGQRVVIELISGFDERAVNQLVWIPEIQSHYWLPVTRDTLGFGSFHVRTRIYLEPGESLAVKAQGSMDISGYVDN